MPPTPPEPPEPSVPCLIGATGSGKTDVGIAVARRIGAEVVCCDAMTVYRGLSIVTAKPVPPPDVPHHLLDFVDAGDSYSAARFVEDADRLVLEIRSRGRIPLVVGGTALYLKAFAKGLGPRVARNPALRESLEALARAEGSEALHARLAAKDPARASEVHANDVRRVIRALEILDTTGSRASDFRREWNAPDRRPVAIVGIRRNEADLDRRIALRVAAMADAGAAAEVSGLLSRGRPLSPEAASAIGFADWAEVAAGRISLAECVERIARATRRFSKRQATFFRQFREAAWVDVSEGQPAEETATAALAAFAGLGFRSG